MKRILSLSLIAICLCIGQAFSQVSGRDEFITKRVTNGIAILSKTALNNVTYTASTSDTSISYNTRGWKTFFVTVQSKDSADLLIKYQLSLNDSTWSAIATKDSLTTATDTGDLKTVDLSSAIGGALYVRVIIAQNASYRLGTTTPKYLATFGRREY